MDNLTRDNVDQLVKKQLDTIVDALVHATITGLLIELYVQNRQWDYGPEVYPCWVVAEDSSNNTRYVYCEHGFGPKLPWGLVSVTGLEMGMDSSWYKTLEGAFYESWAASKISIWNVVKRNYTGDDRVVAHDLTHAEAYKAIAELNAKSGIPANNWREYGMEPRTKIWW